MRVVGEDTATALAVGLADTWAVVLIVCAVVGLLALGVFCLRTSFRETVVYAERPDLFDVLEIEIERARRFNEPLSVIEIDSGATDAAAMSERMRDELRVIDSTTVRGNSVYLVLEGAGAEAASRTVQRLADTRIVSRAEHVVRGATFPDDASTLGGLLAALDDSRVAVDDPTDIGAPAQSIDGPRELHLSSVDELPDERRAVG